MSPEVAGIARDLSAGLAAGSTAERDLTRQAWLALRLHAAMPMPGRPDHPDSGLLDSIRKLSNQLPLPASAPEPD